jgi:hypothetical protein
MAPQGTRLMKQKFLKDGRGRGEGAHYLPWLTIQDVPSSGRSTRALGSTTGRSEKPDLVVLISSFRPCLLLGGGTGHNIRVVGYGESEGATMPGLRQLAWREQG